MRVLVTGGAGFIGSNLVRALVRRGDAVTVIDNLATSLSLRSIEDVLDEIDFVHGDVRCPEDLERATSGRFDVVYHLAASFANELSIEYPLLDKRCNVDGTRHTLDAARKAGEPLFVYAGSSSSYGDLPPPFAEDGPTRPHTPYAASKHAGETCVRESGLPHVVFRLFNVYGPGDLPGRWRNAIPNMMRALSAPDGKIRVHGTEASRDFTYVDDVVSVLLDPTRSLGRTVNVGSGVDTRILDLAKTIVRLFDLPESRIEIDAPRSWDRVVRRVASTALLERLYGRVPETPLDEGLRRTAQWLRSSGYLHQEPR